MSYAHLYIYKIIYCMAIHVNNVKQSKCQNDFYNTSYAFLRDSPIQLILPLTLLCVENN